MPTTRLETTYDAEGKVAAINVHNVMQGTADFGGGRIKPVTEQSNDNLNGNAISDATRTALTVFEAAVAADVQAERERVATFQQAQADEAAARATEAAARAAREQAEVPTP